MHYTYIYFFLNTYKILFVKLSIHCAHPIQPLISFSCKSLPCFSPSLFLPFIFLGRDAAVVICCCRYLPVSLFCPFCSLSQQSTAVSKCDVMVQTEIIYQADGLSIPAWSCVQLAQLELKILLTGLTPSGWL